MKVSTRARMPVSRTCPHLKHPHLSASAQRTCSSPPLSASYKRGVSRVYARPLPLCPAGGNTLDDIITARTHWARDVAHLPNRLSVKWRKPRPVPLTFSGLGGAERLSTSVPAGCYAVIGWKRWKWTSVAERKRRGREGFARGTHASAATHKSCPALKKTFLTRTHGHFSPVSMFLLCFPT